MNKIISFIADKYGLCDLHKEHSKINQFYYNESEVNKLISDYKRFYFEPEFPEIKFENNKLIFRSQVMNEKCNDHAIFYTNLYSGNDDEATNIIMVHGWRAEKLNRLENVFLNDFKEKKYNVYSYILPYHMERSIGSYSGEYFYSSNINRTLLSIKQAINDIRSLIKYLKKDNNKVIIIGLSLGGLVANLLACCEKNIDLLITIFSANSLAFSTFKSEVGKYVKKDFNEKSFDYQKLQEVWDKITPSSNKPLINLNKILLIHGKYDKYVLSEDTIKISNKWGIRGELLQCGHSGIVINKKEISNKVIDFINKGL